MQLLFLLQKRKIEGEAHFSSLQEKQAKGKPLHSSIEKMKSRAKALSPVSSGETERAMLSSF